MMNIERKKKLGAYYTPSEVTDVLSFWAIRSMSDCILEPSFGGCNFLISALNRLKELDSQYPAANIYGFDVDPHAFDFIKEKKLTGGHFFLQDFLDSSIEEHDFKVLVILGNPPYLPIHKLETKYKEKVYRKFETFTHKIPRRSSLWIYFIAHSLQYLQDGGRMAWIVPDSISFTGYGENFLNNLIEKFAYVKLISINERFFQDAGTKEKTSILICEGYKQGRCKLIRVGVDSLHEGLNEVDSMTHVSDIDSKKSSLDGSKQFFRPGFKKAKLGDVFTIRIGIVIGATKLLTYKNQNIESNKYHPKYLYPIVTKGKQLERLSITPEKLLQNSRLPVYLINGLKLEKEDPVLFSTLINSIPPKVLLNVTFKSRSNLFGYDDFNYPDAFLTFYSQQLPRVVLNEGKALNATNSLHRLYLKEPFQNNSSIVKWVSIQLFAGMFYEEVLNMARQYGNNIKKYEPSDASNIPIILPEEITKDFIQLVDSRFSLISILLNNNQVEAAKYEALAFVHDCVIVSEELIGA
jgi:adenine-specific DNA-methyltransferase